MDRERRKQDEVSESVGQISACQMGHAEARTHTVEEGSRVPLDSPAGAPTCKRRGFMPAGDPVPTRCRVVATEVMGWTKLWPASRPPAEKLVVDRSVPSRDEGAEELRYDSNRKHSEPWQRGRRGSLCSKEVRPVAAELLRSSEVDGSKRYAVHQGKAYCAQEHREGWHGYPVGWVEVPERLRRMWQASGEVSKRDIRRYWD